MSENTNNEEIIATLSDGETIIPSEKVETIKKVVEEVTKTEPAKIAEAVKDSDAIELPKASEEKPGLAYVADGVLGSTKVAKAEPKPVVKKTAKKEETVAIYSSRNVTWAEIGKVYIGYNIVSKSASEKWLTRDHTRLATPEEVAKEFGN